MTNLKYTVSNKVTGETASWEGEAKNAHRTLRKELRTNSSIFDGNMDNTTIYVEGADKELADKYFVKGYAYLAKLVTGKGLKKAPKAEKKAPAKKESAKLTEGMMKRIKEAHEDGRLTVLEANFMNYLMTDGYYAEYTFSDVTVEDVATALDMDMKVVKGVLGSLVKKEYLFTQPVNKNELDIIYATDAGYELSDEYETNWKPQMW